MPRMMFRDAPMPFPTGHEPSASAQQIHPNVQPNAAMQAARQRAAQQAADAKRRLEEINAANHAFYNLPKDR